MANGDIGGGFHAAAWCAAQMRAFTGRWLRLTGRGGQTYSGIGANPATPDRGDPLPSREDGKERRVVGFLGVGLDGTDGHRRLTRSEHFVLVGGSARTHERMQDTAIRFGEALERRGKRLEDASAEEAIDLLRESMEG
jgi:hypothetical protein